MLFPQQFPQLTIPTGAGPGQQRITINDQQDGKIKVYNSSGNLVDALGGQQGQFILYDNSGNMVISLASAAGTDDKTGLPFQAGITAYTSTTAINFFANDGTWTASDGSKVVVECTVNAAVFFTPASTHGPWNAGEIIADVDTITFQPSLFMTSPSDTTNNNLSLFELKGSSSTTNKSRIFLGSDEILFSGVVDEITQYGQAFHTFTPTVTGGGTVTWTTQTGWYIQLGEIFFVSIYLLVNAAGSGATNVNVDMPTTVYRGTRQAIFMSTDSIGPSGAHFGAGACIFFTSGSGATSDRLRSSSGGATNADSNITGADLLNGGVIVIQGFYRRS